jgi:HSP20 family molecular chaperone IbpA
MTTKKSKNTRVLSRDRETTLLDEGKFLHIIAKLPGITEEKIRIDLEKTTVTIAITGDGNTDQHVVPLPCEANFCSKRFSDGVLDIILEKIIPDTI